MNQNANKNILQSKQKLPIHPSQSKLCLTLNTRVQLPHPLTLNRKPVHKLYTISYTIQILMKAMLPKHIIKTALCLT